MVVQVKTSSGINLVPDESRLFSERKIIISGEICQEGALNFAKQVMILSKEDSDEPIDVLIQSPGGDVNAGLMMYDIIQTSKVPMRMYCMGEACSMAAILFASGNCGRYMLPHARLMIHEPLIGSRIGGNTSQIQSISENLIKIRDVLNNILSKHTGKSKKVIDKETSYDHFFDAEESMKFGLCDGIAEFSELCGVEKDEANSDK